jgi:serine/threonine protein kinase
VKTNCPNCECEIDFPEIGQESISCPSCGSKIFLSDDGDDQTITVELQRQRLADRFELLAPIGKGQFGEVFKAKDITLDRYVAIKVPFRKSLTYAQLSLVQNEAQAAAQLEHPNIVRIYEVFRSSNSATIPSTSTNTSTSPKQSATHRDTETNDTSPDSDLSKQDSLCIVSQWIDGRSLKDCLLDFQGNYQAIAKLCIAIAQGIHHAHQKGVIHRDLKPANILIDHQKTPHVTDFGLARRDRKTNNKKESEPLIVLGARGEVLGTPAYMSPQQAQGLSESVDGRTDVYSLGIILYELLTGQRPFSGGSRGLIYRVIHEDIPDPRKINTKVPLDLARICQKAAEKKPEDRYSSAQEMAEDLERFLAGEPVHANPWPWSRKIKRTLYKNRTAAAVVLCSLLSIAAASPWLTAKKPDWWASAPTVSIHTTDRNPDAKFLFIKLDPKTWLPDEKLPLQLGPFVGPVNQKIPPGFYRVIASAPNGRFHEVFRTVPSETDPPWGVRYKGFERNTADKSIKLPSIRLFSPPALEGWTQIPAGDFASSSITNQNQRFFVPDILCGTREVTYGDLRSKQVALPMGMEIPADAKDTDPVTGVIFDWAMELAESLGAQLCSETVWEYCSQEARKTGTPLQGFETAPAEVTSLSDFGAVIRYDSASGPSRIVKNIGPNSKDVGFRLYRSASVPTSTDETPHRIDE